MVSTDPLQAEGSQEGDEEGSQPRSGAHSPKARGRQCQALCGSEVEPRAPTRPRSGDAGPLPQHGNSRWEKKIEKQNVYLL